MHVGLKITEYILRIEATDCHQQQRLRAENIENVTGRRVMSVNQVIGL